MSRRNLLSRSKLFTILMVLISAFFLQAFQSPALATDGVDEAAEVVGSGSHDVIRNDAPKISPAADDPAPAPEPRISASIKADPLAGTAPLTVEFSAHFDGRINLDEVSIQWNFANGDTDSAPNTKYTFTEPGEYRVTLIVSDGRTEIVADSVIITVYHATRYCDADCLIAAKLQLESVDLGDTTMLSGTVLVTNENGRQIEGAEVRLVWTRPDGRQIAVTVTTDREGIARTAILANINGMYFLQIDGIERKGFTFDPTRGVLQAGIRR